MMRARNFLMWRDDEHRKLQSNKLENTILPPQSKFNDKGKLIFKISLMFHSNFLNSLYFKGKSKSSSKSKISPYSQRKTDKDAKFSSRFPRRPSVESTFGMDAMESVKTKNAVYCAVVLEEFTKELAAICQEHSVT